MSRSSNVRGRVYCGCSRSPSSKLSSARLPGSPSTPGRSRTHASITTRAAASPPARTASPTVTSSNPRASITRWSTPSKRPQSTISPGLFDHSATRAWVRGRPLALMYKSGRPAGSRLSSARATTSARITWPGPPPAGVSSRKPRLSLEKALMSTVSSDHRPCSRQAEPISETPSGPGKASGHMVSTVATKDMRRLHKRTGDGARLFALHKPSYAAPMTDTQIEADVETLTETLALEPIDVNLFRGMTSGRDGPRIFGGHVIAQSLMAAYETVKDRACHSL